MDHNFYDTEFEEFLKQKADQYKMYPSDRVWNNIHNSLHGGRRWVVLGVLLLFVASSLFIGRQVVLSNYNRMATQITKHPEALSSNKIAPRNIQQYVVSGRPQTSQKAAAGSYTTVAATSPQHQQSNSVEAASHNVNTTSFTPAGRIQVKGITTAEGQPVIIENNLLTAIGAPHTADLNASSNTAEKNANAIGHPEKATPVTAPVTSPLAQNDFASIDPIKPSRFFLQLYGGPIVSYRRLSNEAAQPDNSVPVSATYAGNINRYVHHKPAPGVEMGGKVLYKLSNNLSIYAGAQLNYSRYYIDAYKYRVEKASIALNNSSLHDTLSGYTNIRNFSGYEPEQLQNQYWQLSVPIGVEIKLLGDKKLQLNVAGGVQPTFLINSNSYLISSDYKNYIQSPDLARSFNVHTNFEAFVSYEAAGIRWQLGPQFRSQLLSSYSNQYRVREYLTEFGIKFGITKTIR